jgi:predicted dinucleotide-binding enzyme
MNPVTTTQRRHIAMLGSGLMGSALGGSWARRGHTVSFSFSRDERKLRSLARNAGGQSRAASPTDAVRSSDVVVVAVPWHQLVPAIESAGGPEAFRGRTVLTCSLPMTADDADLALGHTTSGAEDLAERLPGAKVVAAFNTIPSELLHPAVLRPGSRTARPAVVLCGDDAEAKRIVAGLARDIGLDPLDAGSLRTARWVEPFGVLVGHFAYARELGPELGYRFVRYRSSRS